MVNEPNSTHAEIMRAIAENALETIQTLLVTDPSTTLLFFDERGRSPLQLAVENGHKEMAMLVEQWIREVEGAGVCESQAQVHWQYTAFGRYAIQQEIREETKTALNAFNAQQFFF